MNKFNHDSKKIPSVVTLANYCYVVDGDLTCLLYEVLTIINILVLSFLTLLSLVSLTTLFQVHCQLLVSQLIDYQVVDVVLVLDLKIHGMDFIV